MNLIDKIDPNAFALLAAFLGILITVCLDADEQNAVGNFIVSIGQSTLTKAAQIQNIKTHSDIEALSSQVDELSRQLIEIKRKLK